MSKRKYFTAEEKKAAKAARSRAWRAANPGREEASRDRDRRSKWKAENHKKIKGYQRKCAHRRTDEALEQRKCVQCGSRNMKSRWYCVKCSEARNAHLRQRLLFRREAGICLTVGCPDEVYPGYAHCEDCVRKRRAASLDARFRQYGMTRDDYEAMFNAQDRCCGVCRTPKSLRWHIDHDHSNGNVRGILCHNCNLAIGHAKESDVTLRALADYVVLHRALAMPKAV